MRTSGLLLILVVDPLRESPGLGAQRRVI